MRRVQRRRGSCSGWPKLLTRGASFVTEHNTKTGGVRQWMESYNQAGKVNRVHPKSINGQTVNSQHYPPTARELGL
ncbi:MAG: hypothetical protein CENE_02309 [Candidatus Celerinatantimonas neptuna]|nr:MAG: hypothetical protein CENE_02309 [Candidatus Celerinatantimonas neptuna]